LTNNYVVGGGDGYPVFSGREISLDRVGAVMRYYLEKHGVINPNIEGRIVCTSSGDVACPAIL